jgi:hypothetical protein
MAPPPTYRRPLSVAFTTTLMAVVFLGAGAAGYHIEKSNWSFVTVTRTEGVVWWQIWAGIIAALCAVYFWRQGLQLFDASNSRLP